MTHEAPSALAGTTVRVNLGDGEVDYEVEDYWDRIHPGGSWMTAQGNAAALAYAARIGLKRPEVPIDDEVLYGKIGAFGHLVHVSEVLA
jgi:hypothetical protein